MIGYFRSGGWVVLHITIRFPLVFLHRSRLLLLSTYTGFSDSSGGSKCCLAGFVSGKKNLRVSLQGGQAQSSQSLISHILESILSLFFFLSCAVLSLHIFFSCTFFIFAHVVPMQKNKTGACECILYFLWVLCVCSCREQPAVLTGCFDSRLFERAMS